jgi:Family of unknown function (DUF6345)
LAETQVIPSFSSGQPFRVAELPLGGTVAAIRRSGKRTDRRLETQVRYAIEVAGPGGEFVPLVGGGGRFGVSFGHEGRVTGYQGTWRPAIEAVETAEAIEPKDAEDRFRGMTESIEVTDVRSWLAYYAAPSYEAQAVLAPVYVFGAKVVLGRREVPMRLITIPATDFGRFPPRQEPQPERKPKKRPRSASRRGQAAAVSNPFEARTSWIGLSGGLSGSQANAQGFMDGLIADGWLANFDWGDGNAWESDWRRNDDTWVDAADFVDVFARWDGAFDGLHIMLAYGAITLDNTDEGRKLDPVRTGRQAADRRVVPGREGDPAIDQRRVGAGRADGIGRRDVRDQRQRRPSVGPSVGARQRVRGSDRARHAGRDVVDDLAAAIVMAATPLSPARPPSLR